MYCQNIHIFILSVIVNFYFFPKLLYTTYYENLKGPIHDSDLQSQPRCAARSRLVAIAVDGLPTRSDRSVHSFSVESQFSTMSDLDSDDLANIALF